MMYNCFNHNEPSRLSMLIAFSLGAFLLAFGETNTADSLTLDTKQLKEVVVTAQESRQATSASVIDTTAMRHLQPSGFTDLLELLPGNITKDPDMGQVNSINIRQATNVGDNDDYATSALGTLFVVDGMPMNTNSQLQTTPDANQSQRLNVGNGVDMRRISTDDIAQVEIVRGIPSVEYGELTSGLVKIKRKSGVSLLQARFKADNQSRLVYAGKGFTLGHAVINSSLSWLDAKIDPRNSRENYQRLGATVRSDYNRDNESTRVRINSALDYTATFETDDNDPDLTVNNTIDYFSKRDHSLAFSSSLSLNPIDEKFFREFTANAGVTASFEHLRQQKHVTSSRVMPMPVSMTPGSNNVGYLPMLYLSDFDVYGRPFTAYAKAIARFRHVGYLLTTSLNAGSEWNMNKNYGKGECYDINRPLVAGNNSRPRPFSDIPSQNIISSFVETQLSWHPQSYTLNMDFGLRTTSLVGLDSKYYLHGKVYVDPRVNVACIFPEVDINNFPLRVELTGGIGQHTKMPVAAYLYPDLLYSDFEQLNYYHNEPRYRVMNVMTYVEDLTNYDLRAARNLKWEVRGDISYRGNRLSVTYFRENMPDGFRYAGSVHRYLYNKYDATSYNPYANDCAPAINDLPYQPAYYQAVRTKVTNGSRTYKSGIEFTMQSRRLPSLRTRLTVTGAWLRTVNTNSDPLWYKPTIVIAGKEYQYIGLYDDNDGSVYESFNTNFLFDTDIPRLHFNFSIGIQNMWFTSRRTMYNDGIPTQYIDLDGNLNNYTQASVEDPYLSQLIRHYSASAFDKVTVPLQSTVNLKATKSFWKDRIGLALYVNRLLAIMPDYERYGVTIRRYTSPYFGMEINLSI